MEISFNQAMMDYHFSVPCETSPQTSEKVECEELGAISEQIPFPLPPRALRKAVELIV